MARILIIDDEESLRYTFRSFLAREGYAVETAGSYEDAVARLEAGEPFDVIFADIVLPGSHTGLDFLASARSRNVECPVIMVTGQPEVETAAEAVRQGAFDYVPKPVRRDTLLRLTRSALKFYAVHQEKRRIEAENEQVRRHMAAVFQSVEDAILTVDQDLRILSGNMAARETCGLSAGEVNGKPLAVLGPGCMAQCGRIARQTLRDGQAQRNVRLACGRRDGPARLVAVNGSVLRDAAGRQTGAVLVIRDITRIDHLERKLAARRRFGGMIGQSSAMQKIYRLLEDLADLDTTVLITGESGTGKELVAEALHAGSRRSSGPLVKVNCSALSENLLESELFGHVKGAFTGAVKDKAGRFEKADGGTLFLDEIGEISPAVQVKLLRVLQEREIERVGDSAARKIDVRVVSATNQDLSEKIRQGLFREDLYYRLKVMNFHLPPLRERQGDIPLLVAHFSRELNEKMNRAVQTVSDGAMACLLRHDWPGNIRQLKHSLEHAFVLCRGAEIRREHLPEDVVAAPGAPSSAPAMHAPDDRASILTALEKTGWNKAKAARRLGIARQTLYRKMHELGISPSEAGSAIP